MPDSNTRICPNCNAKLEPPFTHCSKCGQTFTDEESMKELKLGEFFQNKRKNEEAIVHFDRVLSRNPKILQAWFNKGVSLFRLGKYDDAIICFDKAIEINPRYKELWKMKYLALYNLNNKEEALECVEKLIEFDRYDKEALYIKALTLMRLDMFKEAVSYFERVLKINPYFEKAFHYRTEILKSIETINNSKWLDEIEVSREKSFNYQFEKELGDINLKPEHPTEAKDFTKALWLILDLKFLVTEIEKFDKKGPLVKMYKKDFLKSKDPNKRIRFLETLIKKVPNNIKIWKILENHYFEQKKIYPALKCDEKIVILDPYDDYAWARLGFLQLLWGEINNAKSSFKNSLEVNPNNEKIIHALSAVYEYLGEKKLAVETLMEYLKINPNDTFELERLNLLKKGKTESFGLANRISQLEMRQMYQEGFNTLF